MRILNMTSRHTLRGNVWENKGSDNAMHGNVWEKKGNDNALHGNVWAKKGSENDRHPRLNVILREASPSLRCMPPVWVVAGLRAHALVVCLLL